jgi:hypothetical protein
MRKMKGDAAAAAACYAMRAKMYPPNSDVVEGTTRS